MRATVGHAATIPASTAATIYSPLVRASFNGPERIQRALWWWAEFYAPPSVTKTAASSFGYTTETISIVHLLNGELVQ